MQMFGDGLPGGDVGNFMILILKAGGKERTLLKDLFENLENSNIGKKFDNLYYKKQPNTWDYQWQYLCFLMQVCLVCLINLVENFGFGEEATHTFQDPLRFNNKLKKGAGLISLNHQQNFYI